MGDVVTLDVRDDGIGFVPSNGNGVPTRGGFGLTAMRQRVDRVSGQLEVESRTGEGTAISVSVPAIPVEGTMADSTLRAEFLSGFSSSTITR